MMSEVEIETSMTDLAKLLTEELRNHNWTLREAEEAMKVSRSTLGNILNDDEMVPRLETLDKLATYWKLPLWRVIEMAGIDLGYPRTMDELSMQLTNLAQRLPEIEPIVGYLLRLYPDDLRGVMAYLEVLNQQSDRARGWHGGQPSPHQQGD